MAKHGVVPAPPPFYLGFPTPLFGLGGTYLCMVAEVRGGACDKGRSHYGAIRTYAPLTKGLWMVLG